MSAKFRKNFLVFFFFVISYTLQNHGRACFYLAEKFGTRIGGLKANTSIDFGVNPISKSAPI